MRDQIILPGDVPKLSEREEVDQSDEDSNQDVLGNPEEVSVFECYLVYAFVETSVLRNCFFVGYLYAFSVFIIVIQIKLLLRIFFSSIKSFARSIELVLLNFELIESFVEDIR